MTPSSGNLETIGQNLRYQDQKLRFFHDASPDQSKKEDRAVTSSIPSGSQPTNTIRPMPFGLSLVYFGIPTAVFFVGFHVVMPALIAAGNRPFYAFLLATGTPLALMLAASLVAYRLEGNAMTWPDLRHRFRLHPMSGKTWLSTIGVFILLFLFTGIALGICQRLIAAGVMPVPKSLPAWLDPVSGMLDISAMDQAFGGLTGNWVAVISYLILLALNIIGEEFWWRGYILPRQELAFGKGTWVIHGTMWALFHAFKWWHIIGLLPMTLGLSLYVIRSRNTTPGIVMHLAFNALGLIPIILGVLGKFG
ncbi:MAG: CPBP family intramembrane glutamic endopeptidase [Thermoanaerobaculales bacterium]|nr:CPBP family intramembrane glutamic endopeptidase [Thermoanaerobaculales bacterium]